MEALVRIKPIAVTAFFLLAFTATHATELAWPKLMNGNHRPECKTALRLARSAYKSTAFNLWEPQALPNDLNDTLVLGPQGVDLSGGDALDVNLNLFTKIPLPEYSPRSVYWQTKTHQNKRLIVEEMPHGWRGDAYTIHVAPPELTTPEFFSASPRQGIKGLTTLIDGTWRAPLVFQQKNTEELWLVYVGEPYIFSPNWVVYSPQKGQLQEACEIQFRPNIRHPVVLLPKPIQQLAALLDQSIGKGEDEGTLQPTARIRIDVNQAWANAALRPWAMGTPYNSRKEIDANLSTWARSGKSYRAAYTNIQTQYKIAEQSLAAYYRQQLKMSKPQSISTAVRVLDTVLRTHYVFPKLN